MDEDKLPDNIKEAIADRYEGWELTELLDLSVRDIMYYFEAEIIEKLEEIKEELRIEDDTEQEYDPF